MTPIVQRLKDVKPDVLLAISFPNDAILFQRKAKELDFNVGAFVGVSAGYSNPDLRNSIGDMVNGIFVSDFAAKVNPKVLAPETVRKVAEEFFKRYDDKMKRPPAGHASSSFSAIVGAVHRGAAEGQDLRAGRAARDRAQARPAGRALANGSGIKFTNNDWPTDAEGRRPEPARLDRRLAVAEERQQSGLPEGSGDARYRDGAVAGLEPALAWSPLVAAGARRGHPRSL